MDTEIQKIINLKYYKTTSSVITLDNPTKKNGVGGKGTYTPQNPAKVGSPPNHTRSRPT